MGLLDQYIQPPQKAFDLNEDGFSLGADDEQDSGFDFSPVRNSMQFAQSMADQHRETIKNLTNQDNINAGYGQRSMITPSQRFHIDTGLIDAGIGTGDKAIRNDNGNITGYQGRDRGGFTPQAQWNDMFTRQMTPPPAATRPSSGYSWNQNYPRAGGLLPQSQKPQPELGDINHDFSPAV